MINLKKNFHFCTLVLTLLEKKCAFCNICKVLIFVVQEILSISDIFSRTAKTITITYHYLANVTENSSLVA